MKDEILGKIITFGIGIGLCLMIGTFVIHELAEGYCIEYEDSYFRWQEKGGLFGGMEKVYTTEEKADGMMKKCSNYLGSSGRINIAENIERITNAQRSTP